MTHEILYRPGAAVARLLLEPGEAVRAETGAMLAMTGEIDIEARTGGLRRVVGRLLAGESAFQSRFVAARGGGEVILAPSAPGDVEAIRLRGEGMLVTSGAFLAAEDRLEVDARTRLKNLFVGESLFMLRVSGEGTLFVSAFGAIHARKLQAGEILKVETGHLVAWSEGDGRAGGPCDAVLGRKRPFGGGHRRNDERSRRNLYADARAAGLRGFRRGFSPECRMKTNLLLLAAFLLAGCGAGSEEVAAVGSTAPEIKVETLTAPATTASLSKRRGKVVLLDFWATWCGPCRQISPSLEAIYERNKTKGLEAMAITSEARETVAIVEKARPHTMPVYLDPDGKAATAFGANALPTMVVVDRAGHIVYQTQGVGPNTADEISDAVDKALEGA